jgi:hypothetical protein
MARLIARSGYAPLHFSSSAAFLSLATIGRDPTKIMNESVYSGTLHRIRAALLAAQRARSGFTPGPSQPNTKQVMIR